MSKVCMCKLYCFHNFFGSAVYLYHRKSDRKEIIIKQITIDDLTTDERRGVMNEIEVSKMFDHPNIIKYHEYFLEDKTCNIVMEYAPGMSIKLIFLMFLLKKIRSCFYSVNLCIETL